MTTSVLNPELTEMTTQLCNALAVSKEIIAAKAQMDLFFHNPEATKLFQEVNTYGEELRDKHLAGMPPSEEEIARFDKLRQAVIDNEFSRGFLEARQQIDEILATINTFLGMTIDLGRAPSPEEVEETRKQAEEGCSCGGHCGEGKEEGHCCHGHGDGDGDHCCHGHGHGDGEHCCHKHDH